MTPAVPDSTELKANLKVVEKGEAGGKKTGWR